MIIRAEHEAVVQEERGAVSEERVALHFAEADAAAELAALDRLTGEVVHWPRGADLVFVLNHVAQTLVVHHADVDVRVELRAGEKVRRELMLCICARMSV